MTEPEVRDALREVIDPELGINIVDLGLVYRIELAGDDIVVTITMTTPACPMRDYMQDLVQSTLAPDVKPTGRVVVDIVSDPPWSEEMMTDAGRRQLG
jgi:metal-sulfur cluster biosynthetic enzyme